MLVLYKAMLFVHSITKPNFCQNCGSWAHFSSLASHNQIGESEAIGEHPSPLALSIITCRQNKITGWFEESTEHYEKKKEEETKTAMKIYCNLKHSVVKRWHTGTNQAKKEQKTLMFYHAHKRLPCMYVCEIGFHRHCVLSALRLKTERR